MLKIEGRLGEYCELKEMRILNRIITLTETGVLYAAKPRHYELMIRNLGLDEAKGAVTPGVKPTNLDLEAIKEGKPEPRNAEAWQNDDEYMSASMRGLCDNEVKKNVEMKNMFVTTTLFVIFFNFLGRTDFRPISYDNTSCAIARTSLCHWSAT